MSPESAASHERFVGSVRRAVLLQAIENPPRPGLGWAEVRDAWMRAPRNGRPTPWDGWLHPGDSPVSVVSVTASIRRELLPYTTRMTSALSAEAARLGITLDGATLAQLEREPGVITKLVNAGMAVLASNPGAIRATREAATEVSFVAASASVAHPLGYHYTSTGHHEDVHDPRGESPGDVASSGCSVEQQDQLSDAFAYVREALSNLPDEMAGVHYRDLLAAKLDDVASLRLPVRCISAAECTTRTGLASCIAAYSASEKTLLVSPNWFGGLLSGLAAVLGPYDGRPGFLVHELIHAIDDEQDVRVDCADGCGSSCVGEEARAAQLQALFMGLSRCAAVGWGCMYGRLVAGVDSAENAARTIEDAFACYSVELTAFELIVLVAVLFSNPVTGALVLLLALPVSLVFLLMVFLFDAWTS